MPLPDHAQDIRLPADFLGIGANANRMMTVQFQTLLLEIGPAAAEKYTTPGQYLQVRLKGGKPGFYAIASTPEGSASGTVELLVRCRGENAEALCRIEEGEIA